MPLGKPRPTGAVGSSSSQQKNIWSKVAESQLPKSDYEYKQLGKRQIRILRLHAADSPGEPIECSLDAYDIDEVIHQYNALSYTWGNKEPTEKIKLRTPQEPPTGTGGARLRSLAQSIVSAKKSFYIRPNLIDALRRFRDTSDKQEDLLLWIDAICINQPDQKEKSMQVARMAEIYSKAGDVLIWLGKEYNASSTAMDFIPKILDLEQSAALISKESNRKQWTALADLMKREWFSRRWVVQELVLAPKNRYLYCGDKELHWSDFERAVSFFTRKLDVILAMFTSSAEFRQNAKILADIRALGATALVNITNELTLENTLESLVARLPMFEAADPRDIIYSLLSIAGDTQNWNDIPVRKQIELREKGLVPFEADYEKDILEVFKDFTAFCIQTSGSLDIICRHWAPSQFRSPSLLYRMKMRADNERSQADSTAIDFTDEEESSPMTRLQLPSWIGLLSESPYGIPDVGRSAGESLVGAPNDAWRYHASGKSDASVQFGENDAPRSQGTESVRFPDSLETLPPSKYIVSTKETLKKGRERRSDGSIYVHGFTVGVIGQVSHRLFEGMIPAEWLERGGSIKPGRDPKDIPDHFWRTLVADRDKTRQPAHTWYYTALDNALTKRNSNGDLITTDLIRQGQPEDMVAFLQRAQNVIWNRKFFLLEGVGEGRFGLGPDKAQEGDLVCILFGCSVPVVLRKILTTHGPVYTLVGEAFIYGMMEGQAHDAFKYSESTVYRLV